MLPTRPFLDLDDQQVVVGALRFADVVMVAATGIASFWFRHGTDRIPEEYLVAIAIGALLAANYMQVARLYRFAELHRFALQFGTLTASWSAVILTLLVIGYFGKVSGNFSRVWAVSWFVSAYVALAALRGLVSLLLDRWARQGRLTYNVVVVGAGPYGERLVRHLERQRDAGVRVLGLFDDRRTRVPSSIDGHGVLGSVDELLAFARRQRIDEIAVALPWSAEARLIDILKKLRTLPVDVKLCPGDVAFDLPNLGYGEVAGVPMLTLLKPPLTGWKLIVKAIEDRILSAFLIFLFAPLMVLIALGIKMTSNGPVLFRQKRYGFNNNEITVLKFRTMRWDPSMSSAVPQARRNDARVTWFGRLLRHSSLDELPQFFNVLYGEMSLVGPRPHAVAHNEQYAAVIDEYLSRHRVKPGITGWAQVNGLRGETHTPELMRRRVQYDLDYIENWSLLLDLKILAMTPFVGFVHENAY
jgi:putative colanic acid biosynthesis UDP-glucose lipid carrier transferase